MPKMNGSKKMLRGYRLYCRCFLVCFAIFMVGTAIYSGTFFSETRRKVIFEGAALSAFTTETTVFESRRKKLLSTCKAGYSNEYATNNEETIRNHFVVDRKNRLLFCGMEKVGCSFWKRVLQITSGVKNASNPLDIPAWAAHDFSVKTLAGLPFYEIIQIVDSFTKFIFVREPYARTFSGYIDKIFRPNTYYFPIRREIFRFIHGREPSKHVCAPRISFREFMSYLIYTLKTGVGRDGHFVPMYDHCRPCVLKYDIIGKMETFGRDTQFILESQSLNSKVKVNMSSKAINKDTIIDTFKNVYKTRSSIEKCMSFLEALQVSWSTLHIRGIIDSRLDFPPLFTQTRIPDINEIILEAIKANEQSDPLNLKANRVEVLNEAFQSIAKTDLDQYRDIFGPDFNLFDYNHFPEHIFAHKRHATEFSHLNFTDIFR